MWNVCFSRQPASLTRVADRLYVRLGKMVANFASVKILFNFGNDFLLNHVNWKKNHSIGKYFDIFPAIYQKLVKICSDALKFFQNIKWVLSPTVTTINFGGWFGGQCFRPLSKYLAIFMAHVRVAKVKVSLKFSDFIFMV